MVEDLAAFPNTKVVYDARYVESGKILTTAGLTSGIDGALHVVSKILSMGEAQSAALGIEYRWEPHAEWARGAMADRFLPDGLCDARARLKGAEAKMISTAGDATRWETRILVSRPETAPEIAKLLHERIMTNSGFGGMSRRISHLRSGPISIAARTSANCVGSSLTILVTPGAVWDASSVRQKTKRRLS